MLQSVCFRFRGTIMFNKTVLRNLLNHRGEIKNIIDNSKYTNFRICLPKDEEYSTLHFIVKYIPNENRKRKAYDDVNVETSIATILGCDVKIWKEGSSAVDTSDLTEDSIVDFLNANNNELEDFFNENLLPLCEDKAIVNQSALPIFFNQSPHHLKMKTATDKLIKALEMLGEDKDAWQEAELLFQKKKRAIFSEQTQPLSVKN